MKFAIRFFLFLCIVLLGHAQGSVLQAASSRQPIPGSALGQAVSTRIAAALDASLPVNSEDGPLLADTDEDENDDEQLQSSFRNMSCISGPAWRLQTVSAPVRGFSPARKRALHGATATYILQRAIRI